ncbi:MAG: arginine--tRNA ligase [Thermoplasmataceae archaeon]
MLMYQDVHEKLVSVIRNQIPEFRSEDLSFDKTGHCDMTVKMFRYNANNIESLRLLISKEKFVTNAEVEGNYINLTIDSLQLLSIMINSISSTGQYPDTFQDPERVCVEHTSINPTGPIHVGRVRNSILGDSIARMLKRYGYRVTTQYFINDSGKQMMSLYLAYEKYSSGLPLTPQLLLDGYKRIYKEMEEEGSEAEVEEMIKKYESGDPAIINKVREIAAVMLDDIKKDLDKLEIKIDDFTWESDFIITGEVRTLIDSISDVTQIDGKARYIELENGRKVYLTRSDGSSLYLVRDLAYHMYKLSQNDWLITVLGEDHSEHGKTLSEILTKYFDLVKKLDFVLYAFVSLETGSMSTRKGNAVTVKELVEKTYERALEVIKEKRGESTISNEIAKKIAVSAIRFNILKVNSSKAMVFKWKDALDFNGDSAPFVMYSYVRALNILNKSAIRYELEPGEAVAKNLKKEESSLILNLYQYPFVIAESVKNLKPEMLANFAFMLSKTFNDFYENCKVNSEEYEISVRRLMIVNIYKNIIEDVSSIIGIQLVPEM